MASNKKTPSRSGARPPRTITVTPEIAKQWLERNENNRILNTHRVQRYAEDMANGSWQVTGDAIRFSKSGKLLDGQHRLWACVKSNSNFDTVVYTGLPEDSQMLMDQGMARSKGSQLTLRGYKNGAILSSAALTFWRMERGRTTVFARATSPSNSDMLMTIEENQDIVTRLEQFMAIKPTPGLKVQQGSLIAMYTYMARHDESKANAFIEGYLTGVNLPPGSPALALRERVFQYRQKGWKILHTDFLTWAAYAWKAFLQNRPLSRIAPKNPLPEFPGSPPWDQMAAEEE